ncbi:hypothetical protein ABZS96_43290 [Streptomyces avermitilis]|uniref:hypothetical protein n=1 Tax=Streptomyces avermitilis TaxID=33903 RepID=UPI0033A26548
MCHPQGGDVVAVLEVAVRRGGGISVLFARLTVGEELGQEDGGELEFAAGHQLGGNRRQEFTGPVRRLCRRGQRPLQQLPHRQGLNQLSGPHREGADEGQRRSDCQPTGGSPPLTPVVVTTDIIALA